PQYQKQQQNVDDVEFDGTWDGKSSPNKGARNLGFNVDLILKHIQPTRTRKRDKYMAKCAAIGYGFLPFSFTSLGELEVDAVTLLKRTRKFFMAQDIGARAAVHIFNRISFAIAKGVGGPNSISAPL
ncbi:hypothetical protein Tco_1190294, partial [Tanacetum coccineum]